MQNQREARWMVEQEVNFARLAASLLRLHVTGQTGVYIDGSQSSMHVVPTDSDKPNLPNWHDQNGSEGMWKRLHSMNFAGSGCCSRLA
jgi:hypothetical protein